VFNGSAPPTYLAPEPSKPFVQLTQSLVREFPAHLPYGGQYDDIFSHLADREFFWCLGADAVVSANGTLVSHACAAAG
jgi:hypothetical protein